MLTRQFNLHSPRTWFVLTYVPIDFDPESDTLLLDIGGFLIGSRWYAYDVRQGRSCGIGTVRGYTAFLDRAVFDVALSNGPPSFVRLMSGRRVAQVAWQPVSQHGENTGCKYVLSPNGAKAHSRRRKPPAGGLIVLPSPNGAKAMTRF